MNRIIYIAFIYHFTLENIIILSQGKIIDFEHENFERRIVSFPNTTHEVKEKSRNGLLHISSRESMIYYDISDWVQHLQHCAIVGTDERFCAVS
jgi:hypothetical protein